MSETAERIAGIYIPESEHQRPPTVAWFEFHCRRGSLYPAVEKFAKLQEEKCDPHKVIVELIEADGITCRLPAVAVDHESTHPFRADVCFKMNPLTGVATRITAR